MLKYKRVLVKDLAAGIETITEILSGMAGKNRRIVSIGTEHTTLVPTDYLRVYRDAEQIVDCDLSKLYTENKWLPMDLPLAEGQVCRVGIYGAGDVGTPQTQIEITIGYEEAG